MIFSSIEFFVFLALVLSALAMLPREGRRRDLLLFASYVFYGWWDWRFCLLILGSTVVDYLVGRALGRSREPNRRRLLLGISLVANLGVLGFFKYANFFLDSLRPAFEAAGVEFGSLQVILPVGISFFTFQTMSYTIDVYRGRLAAASSFRDFALFVSFFPQLVAGPIVRGSDFLPQLDREHPARWSNVVEGAGIFFLGFVKKVLFADTLALYVDPVFADPSRWSAMTCWLALIAYAGQIYYDFSGYSQMAIGVGRMLGFELPRNFAHPYRSTSITEFWRRWHISLSGWLRDYLYISLGGNRHGELRTYVNLSITMLLGGLWHGANWTFVVWGGLHGGALALHKLWMRFVTPHVPPPLARRLWPLSWVTTFVFVLITWVFFRAPDFSVAWTYLGRLVGGSGIEWYRVEALTVIAIGALIHVAVVLRDDRDLELDLRRPEWAAVAVAGAFLVLYFAPFGVNPFIYFQF